MSSNRMIRREDKRIRLEAKYKERRKALRAKLNDPDLDLDEKFEVLAEYRKLPKDSSSVRRTRRCQTTGRARGVERQFELCRNEIRRLFNQGEIPGLVKSSW